MAVSFAAGKLVPQFSRGAAWPFEIIGVGAALVGIGFIAYGYRRQAQVEAALARGEYAPLEKRAAVVFTALGALLGLGTIFLVVGQSG